MCAPQMPCEGVSAIYLISATSSSTCQTASPSRTLHSGPRESPSPGAKEALATQQVKAFGTIPRDILPHHQANMRRLSVEVFKRAKQAPTPTPVPLDYSSITNQYNISSAKPGITASVCLSFYKQISWLTKVRVSRRACHGVTDSFNVSSI